MPSKVTNIEALTIHASHGEVIANGIKESNFTAMKYDTTSGNRCCATNKR